MWYNHGGIVAEFNLDRDKRDVIVVQCVSDWGIRLFKNIKLLVLKVQIFKFPLTRYKSGSIAKKFRNNYKYICTINQVNVHVHHVHQYQDLNDFYN